ncbi:sulfolactate dehydrogenase [Pandoraea terrae]|uniref:Sulfolactate dehydrogenase n=1 Tax=Pandoraea terrae TaxID=1537710 RepID=A0A5E4W050_9BURK|nr:Ldh family oxidoreductase [Pandoraea terrae]VVE17086.1 sulfolactate dehydrogenase [Pandoraea terrae]
MTEMTQRFTLEELEKFAFDSLVAGGTKPENAAPLAKAITTAERDGITSHGLAYLPTYLEHVACGKVDGQAQPIVTVDNGVVMVDAKSGFAHPAIAAGFERLIEVARNNGVACLAVKNSYNAGTLGYHAETLASAGLLSLCFTNAPASIAPFGGTKAVIGTNPFALGVPDMNGGCALVIDQCSSVVAKSELFRHVQAGTAIPQGWALDANGQPTTDPAEGLKGTMVPSGGYKGFGVGLMVEVFAALMTGATLGLNASPFSGLVGGPPKTGQFFIAINPVLTGGAEIANRLKVIADAIDAQPGTQKPGDRERRARQKSQAEGVAVSGQLLEKIKNLAMPR